MAKSGRGQLEEDTKPWEWYLAILGCEHAEHPRHLLGRVCYIAPSISDVNVECPFPGYLHLPSGSKVHLFPLSPDTIEHSRRAEQVEMRTVYISHPTRSAVGDIESKAAQPFDEPLGSINLVLPTRARDALRALGYTVEFRHPEQDRDGADVPNTHRLTLSHNDHRITIEYQHSLQGDGRRFTIDAVVGAALSPLLTRPSMGVQEQDAFISHAVS